MSGLLLEVRQRHGGSIYANGTRWVGPGPNHSRRDRSLSVAVINGRVLIHSFTGDALAECEKHLGVAVGAGRSETPAEAAKRRADAARERQAREAEDRRFCVGVWDGTQPIEGTPAEAYLWSRGHILETSDVRFHPAAPRCKPRPEPEPPRLPAMVARVRAPTGEPKALHVTYLTTGGCKALGSSSRLIFGPSSGAAVRLAPMTSEGVLGVGEGIETSSAYATLHGVPCWASLSTAGLQNFTPPDGVKRLVVAVDSDDGGAGMKAALILGDRISRRCAVEVHAAPEGKDWDDVYGGVRHG